MTSSQMNTVINGVDVTAAMQTIQAMRQDPGLGQFYFRARGRWLDGTRNRVTIKDFYGAGKEDDLRTQPYIMDCDEPPVLLGKDQGANPVEYLLAGLSGCVTTATVAHSATRNIEIESVETELEGDIDTRGFLGLSSDVPCGYKRIRLTLKVRSNAPVETLTELARMSPVYNTIIHPTPVDLQIVKV